MAFLGLKIVIILKNPVIFLKKMSKHLKKCLTIVRKILFGISGSHRTEASVFRKFGLVLSTTDWPALVGTGRHCLVLAGTAQHYLALRSTAWH